MKYVLNYKYTLRCWVNEFGNNDKIVEALTADVNRSYGRTVRLSKVLGDLRYHTYCTPYDFYIL